MIKKGISGSSLKIAAVIAMIFDHTAWCILDTLLIKSGVKITDFYSPLSQISVSPVLCVLSPLFHTIGRITFPIMLFLLVEGVKYSRNKKKYIRNMAVFALVSEIPFNLAFRKSVFAPDGPTGVLEGQNVFVTLTLGLTALVLIEKIQKTEKLRPFISAVSFSGMPVFCVAVSWYFVKKMALSFGCEVKITPVALLSVAGVVIYFLLTKNYDREKRHKADLILLITALFSLLTFIFGADYKFVGVTALVIIYLLRSDKDRSFISGCAYLTANSYLEAGSFLALPLIYAYNGKRGARLKYLFYIIYPAHLLILFFIRIALKL